MHGKYIGITWATFTASLIFEVDMSPRNSLAAHSLRCRCSRSEIDDVRSPRNAVKDAVCDWRIKGLFYPVQLRLLVYDGIYEAEGPDGMLLLARQSVRTDMRGAT